MGRVFLFGIVIFLFNCNQPDERCGIIIQKLELETSFYFVLQTDEYINYLLWIVALLIFWLFLPKTTGSVFFN